MRILYQLNLQRIAACCARAPPCCARAPSCCVSAPHCCVRALPAVRARLPAARERLPAVHARLHAVRARLPAVRARSLVCARAPCCARAPPCCTRALPCCAPVEYAPLSHFPMKCATFSQSGLILPWNVPHSHSGFPGSTDQTFPFRRVGSRGEGAGALKGVALKGTLGLFFPPLPHSGLILQWDVPHSRILARFSNGMCCCILV
jgi:hypothetical protein